MGGTDIMKSPFILSPIGKHITNFSIIVHTYICTKYFLHNVRSKFNKNCNMYKLKQKTAKIIHTMKSYFIHKFSVIN